MNAENYLKIRKKENGEGGMLQQAFGTPNVTRKESDKAKRKSGEINSGDESGEDEFDVNAELGTNRRVKTRHLALTPRGEILQTKLNGLLADKESVKAKERQLARKRNIYTNTNLKTSSSKP